MLYLERQPLETIDHLRSALQNAVKLEFSTIPPYLTALYSIKQGTNDAVAQRIRHVVLQEMLHMCLASNILNAVGGHPVLSEPGFPPVFPGPLPMGIGAEPGKPFIVPLMKMSIDLVRKVFMVIEAPEHPQHFPVREALAAIGPEYHTIGQFYAAVREAIAELGPSIFTADPALQVTGWFPHDVLFPITDVATASRAIDVIVSQGEGTSRGPLDDDGGLAHYYIFTEIDQGLTLRKAPDAPNGFAYTQPPVPFDPADVWPMLDNPATVMLPVDSPVARLSDQCDATYSALVNALHAAFNGQPDQLDTAVGLMYSLRLQAQQLMGTPIPGLDGNAGPRFLFTPRNASG